MSNYKIGIPKSRKDVYVITASFGGIPCTDHGAQIPPPLYF